MNYPDVSGRQTITERMKEWNDLDRVDEEAHGETVYDYDDCDDYEVSSS